MLLRVSTEGSDWLLVANKRYGDLLKPSYTLYHAKLVALDFLARALAGRSWSLGGWELHDFRRTGVFIDLSYCFDIIFTSSSSNKTLFSSYQSCIFCYFFFLSTWQNVRTSLTSHPHDTFSIISPQFPSNCFCFIQTATAGP